jgi:hypothetical protein
MTNNPFLKNNNNNRFNFLNDEPPLKNVNVNDKKHFNENRGKRDNYNNNNNNYNYNNSFKSISLSEQPKLDIDNIKAFPTLVNSKERDTNIQMSSNFKDILNNVIEENTIEHKDIILPGWLQLTMLNGKVLKKEYKEEEDIHQQEELNYNMYKIGKALQTNYESYEKEYDSINGEGSYDNNFRLSPVYGSEYDSNSEGEDEDDNNNDNDNDDE